MRMPAGVTFNTWNSNFISFNTPICITDEKSVITTIIMVIPLSSTRRKRTGNSIRKRIIGIGTIDFVVIIILGQMKTLA